ncbi:MAG: 3-dehydroquinate synthase family protein, partial [Actinomycetota bacterium]
MERILIGDLSEILVGRGLPAQVLPPRPDRRLAALLVQPSVSTVAEGVARRLAEEGTRTIIHVLPDGEDAKTLMALEEVYSALAGARMARTDTVIGVGGGAATDVAGFVAATWMRGVEAVHLPTTLLGAVDAAVGGKTGINLGGKNLVGAFWHPRRIIVDLEVLDRLPPELKRQGAAEVIKAGLLADPGVVSAYRHHGADTPLEDVVTRAIRIKAEIVSQDFTETGRRGLLNLGHTVGHGVEFATGISHGEAVAIGLVAEGAISEKLLGFGDLATIKAALAATGLPVRSPPADRRRVLDLVALDKKRFADRIRMALLE